MIGGLRGTAQAIAVQLVLHRLTLIGCLFGKVIGTPHSRGLIEDLLSQVATGQLTIPIDSVFDLRDVVAAHTRAEQRGRLGRVIMAP